MSKLIRGVVAMAGCVLLAGASAAHEPYVQGHFNEEGRYVPPDVREPPPAQKVERAPAKRMVYPEPIKERTKDVLRAKRPR